VGGPSSRPGGGPGPRVLVVVASRHGSTREIAAALTRWLPEGPDGRTAGLSAVLAPVDAAPDPSPFDAVVLGSAVYAGRWMDAAREYATAHAPALRSRPVWLFSSGPIGPPPRPDDVPHDVPPLVGLLAARGHRVFAGRLDPEVLSVGERAMTRAMRAPVGDFREWDAVRGWADELAAAIAASG
jgi:menaquinone-dependent protoporphyrinogen oxidase